MLNILAVDDEEDILFTIKYGFEKFRIEKIIGKAYVENHASVSVLQKCGMKFVKKIIYDKRTALLYEINNEQN